MEERNFFEEELAMEEGTNYVEHLAKLISENPGLEVIPIVNGMAYNDVMLGGLLYPGVIDGSKVCEIAWVDIGPDYYFLTKGDSYMEEVVRDALFEQEFEMMINPEREEAMRRANALFDKIEWRKAILLYIDYRCDEKMC